MSVLSEWDIINELGRGIFIYPFKGKNESITGCCLCLTASEHAYTFYIDQQTQERKCLFLTDKADNLIKIQSRKTAIIWTEESVFLGNYLCGSLHSKVKLVSQGLGHIGTRVNPNYGGVMAIALHNLSDNEIQIKVGETIAYLRIHRLSSKSSFPSPYTDHAGKLEDAIPTGYVGPQDLKDWLNDRENRWRKGEPEEIWKKLKASSQYQTAKNELEKKSIRYRLVFKYLPQWDTTLWAGIIGALATLVVGIPAWLALRPSAPPSFDPKPIITPKTQIAPTPKATSVPK